MNYREMDPDKVLALAAKGDGEAQSELVSYVLGCGELGIETRAAAIVGAEILARMAASHGGAQARLKLAGVLFLRAQADIVAGDSSDAKRRQAEALALTSCLADEGCEKAAASLGALAEEMPSDVVAMAAAMARKMIAPGTVH